MKSRDTLVRLKRFQVDEKQRRTNQIEAMIVEFARIAADLDREIAGEEGRTGISDPSHFAYSTYARAARARRDNLQHSAEELRGQLEEAKRAFEEAQGEFLKAQNLEGREKGPERSPEVLRPMESAAFRSVRA